MEKPKTHYDNLKVSRDAPQEVIRMAYKALALKYHPDRNQECKDNVKIMQALNASFEVLRDPSSRLAYDKWLEKQEANEISVNAPRRSGQNNQNRTTSRANSAAYTPPPKEPGQTPESTSGPTSNKKKPNDRGVIILSALGFLFFLALIGRNDHTPDQRMNDDQTSVVPNPYANTDQSAPAHRKALPLTAKPTINKSNAEEITAKASIITGTAGQGAFTESPEQNHTHRFELVRWDDKTHKIRSEAAPAIRKKIAIAQQYVEEYANLMIQMHDIDERLKKSGRFGSDRLKDEREKLVLKMKRIDVDGTSLIKVLMNDIRSASE